MVHTKWGESWPSLSGLYTHPAHQSDPPRPGPSPVLFSPLFSLFFSLFTPWFHPSHPLIPVMTTMGWICHSSGLSPLLPPPAVFTASRHTRRPWSNKKTPRCASGQWGRRGVWGFFCSVIKRAHLLTLVNTRRGGVACVCGPLGMPVDGGACLFVDLS